MLSKKMKLFSPTPNFLFNEILFESGNDCRILHIYAINKKTLSRCLTEHQELFKERLGPDFSQDNFVIQLEKGDSLISLIDHDEMLLGVLLGYGEESSRAFKEVRKKCTKTFAPPPTETYSRIILNSPDKCPISPVVFMGNPHSLEVQELKVIYERELELIWKIYNESKNNLKTVLDRICSEPKL